MSHPAEADWVRRQAEIMRQRAENAKSDKERDLYRREAENYEGWLARLEKEK